jgi:hypothetical protein
MRSSASDGLITALGLLYFAGCRSGLTGYQVSFGIGAGLVLLALVIAGTVLRPAEAVNEDSLPNRGMSLDDVALPGARVR